MSLIIDPLIHFANISTVFLGAFSKVPQIWAVGRAKSTAGVSVASVMLELTGYCITMSYFIAGSYALTSYLEYPFLVAQDSLLLCLVAWLGSRNAGTLTIVGYGGVLVALVAAMVGGHLAPTKMTLLATSATPISAVSKVVQLSAIVGRKSSEGIAVSSWFISAFTCFTRLFTVFVESADAALLLNFGVSLLLNIAIIAAVFYYAPSKTRSKKLKKK